MTSPGEFDATQPISQSYYEEILSKSRNNRTASQAYPRESASHSQFTLKEGDEGHVDIASSFMLQDESSQVVEQDAGNFLLTQSQNHPQWSQFPESQRFKTPVTVGKKRRYNGQIVDTPITSLNPLTAVAETTPTGIIGLSQAFAATQAASSPNALPTNPRSDRPSPQFDLHNGPLKTTSSSPLRTISDTRRGATEPVTRYVSLRQSQDKRENNDKVWNVGEDSKSQNNGEDESDDEQPSIITRSRRKKERDNRVREELRKINSSLPEHDVPSRRSRPFTDPNNESDHALISDQSEAETEHDDPVEIAVRRSSQVQHAGCFDKENAPNLVPETTLRRQHGVVSQVDGSPSERLGNTEADNVKRGISSSGPIRVADSQPSQHHYRKQGHISDTHITNMGDASQILGSDDLQSSPTSSTRSSRATRLNSKALEKGSIDDTSGTENPGMNSGIHSLREIKGAVSNQDFASTIQETDVSQQQNHKSHYSTPDTVDDRNPVSDFYETAHSRLGHQISSAMPLIQATSPKSKPPTGRRNVMADISAEPTPRKSGTQNSFDAMEILELDSDANVAAVFAESNEALIHDSDTNTAAQIGLHPGYQKISSNHGSENLHSRENEQLARGQKSPADRATSKRTSQTVVRSHRVGNYSKPRVEATSPSKSRRRVSEFDIGPSPKAKSQAEQRSAIQRKRLRSSKPASQMATDEGLRRTEPEETHADPLGDMGQRLADVDERTAPESTTSHDLNQPNLAIVAPNMVFACFNGKIRAYYPAICLGPSPDDPLRFEVQFEGCDIDVVDEHGIRTLNLRVGDVVKVNREGFPKVAHVVQGFNKGSEQDLAEGVMTDVYGHASLFVAPKPRKGLTKVSSVENQKEVPVGSIYLDSNMWGQMKDREYHFVSNTCDTGQFHGCMTPNQPKSPVTPQSRGRRLQMTFSRLSNMSKSGIFANMAFAISLEDTDYRNTLSKLVQDNGGLVITDSFSELFQPGVVLKTNMANLGFTAVLTDQFSRKTKYHEALALSLPCLHTRWLTSCIEHKRIVNWLDYLLAAGESDALDGAVRSRILPLIDAEHTRLGTMVAARPKFFQNETVMFVTGRSMEEAKRASFFFILEALGANKVEKAVDVQAAVKLLSRSDSDAYQWVFVEDHRWERARQLILSSKFLQPKDGANESSTRPQCKVAKHETIVQSLILGRLYEDEIMDELEIRK